ncbi:unnamed protein product [Scytosiphon promiscuus]
MSVWCCRGRHMMLHVSSPLSLTSLLTYSALDRFCRHVTVFSGSCLVSSVGVYRKHAHSSGSTGVVLEHTNVKHTHTHTGERRPVGRCRLRFRRERPRENRVFVVVFVSRRRRRTSGFCPSVASPLLVEGRCDGSERGEV